MADQTVVCGEAQAHHTTLSLFLANAERLLELALLQVEKQARTPRRLMRLYYLLGDRAEALRQYERCAAALDEELGVNPSKSTLTLYRQIQADQLDEPEPMPAPQETNTSLEVSSTPLIDVLGQLKYLEGSLADLQNQIQRSIQKVELVLSINQ